MNEHSDQSTHHAPQPIKAYLWLYIGFFGPLWWFVAYLGIYRMNEEAWIIFLLEALWLGMWLAVVVPSIPFFGVQLSSNGIAQKWGLRKGYIKWSEASMTFEKSLIKISGPHSEILINPFIFKSSKKLCIYLEAKIPKARIHLGHQKSESQL